MKYKSKYKSPVGELLIIADDQSLTGLWYTKDSKYYNKEISEGAVEKPNKAIDKTKKWLDMYFDGEEPDFMPEISFGGSDFQKRVWEKLLEVPYGVTTTYGEIAREIKCSSDGTVSAQAVGQAVGHNPISIIVPCHRVIGSDGDLTGYAGGLKRKKALLQLEGAFDEI